LAVCFENGGSQPGNKNTEHQKTARREIAPSMTNVTVMAEVNNTIGKPRLMLLRGH
jgi:hypothetical protein